MKTSTDDMAPSFLCSKDHRKPPIGLRWRSSTFFIVSTVGIGMFTDMFLYGLIVPVLPFMLKDRVHIPVNQTQDVVSDLLAVYAAASMASSPVAGVITDRAFSSRQLPFLTGLVFLTLATVLLAVGQNILVLAVARFLQGASGGIVWTIGTAMLVETVGQENLGKTMGSIFSFISVAGLFAPILGGVLYAKFGYGGVFAVGIALLVIDFLMRLVVIEKKAAGRYMSPSANPSSTLNQSGSASPTNENTPLLTDPSPPPYGMPEATPCRQDHKMSAYRLPEATSYWTIHLPILQLLRDPSLLAALFIGFVQAILLGAFDATVPLMVADRYGFDSLKAGLLFLPLGGSDLLFGPLFGWAVDRFGTKPLSTLGFTWLVPILTLLRLPAEVTSTLDRGHQIALYASLLALNGVGLAIINSCSLVECGAIVEKYYQANPERFEQAPYAQLYGINSMIWSGGLTVGPLAAGALRQRIGYGNMNAVMAGICGFTAILSFVFVGDSLRKGKKKSHERDSGVQL